MVKYVRSRFFLLGLLLAVAVAVGSMAATVSYFGAGAADQLGVSLATLISGEDETNHVLRVEGQYSYKVCTADCQVKGTAGYVHTVTCATAAGAAVAAAGAITIRDAATETTPIAATIDIPATAFVPFTVTLDSVMTTGIYFAYDGTLTAASVSCTISYR
jgi:hypothetical protein